MNDISLDYHGDDGELDSRSTKPLVSKNTVKNGVIESPKQYIVGVNHGMLTSGSTSAAVSGSKAAMNNHLCNADNHGNDSIDRDTITTNSHTVNSSNNHHQEEGESKNGHGSYSLPDQNGVDGNIGNDAFRIGNYEDEEEAS